MSDLKRWQVSDERLTEFASGLESDVGAMAAELRDLRSARAANAELVRDVVRVLLNEPGAPVRLEAWCESVATRAAEQLATAVVGLSAEERTLLRHLRDDVSLAETKALRVGEFPDAQLAAAQGDLLDRLLESPPATDLRAAILAILDSDAHAGDVRKALAELVGRQ